MAAEEKWPFLLFSKSEANDCIRKYDVVPGELEGKF